MANRRFFQEQLERECTRIHRYPEPFTIAYFDLDDFKYINDSIGHDVGDQLLQTVAETLLKNIRASDYPARLGGDEFAVLFPVLDQESAIPLLSSKLHAELVTALQNHAWPVTFSLRAVTFISAMESSRDMVKQVDDLMYEAKKAGKNTIRHRIWPVPQEHPH